MGGGLYGVTVHASHLRTCPLPFFLQPVHSEKTVLCVVRLEFAGRSLGESSRVEVKEGEPCAVFDFTALLEVPGASQEHLNEMICNPLLRKHHSLVLDCVCMLATLRGKFCHTLAVEYAYVDVSDLRTYVDVSDLRTYIHVHMYVHIRIRTYVRTYLVPFLPTLYGPASSDCSRSPPKGQEVKGGEDQCAWPSGHRPGSCRDGGGTV